MVEQRIFLKLHFYKEDRLVGRIGVWQENPIQPKRSLFHLNRLEAVSLVARLLDQLKEEVWRSAEDAVEQGVGFHELWQLLGRASLPIIPSFQVAFPFGLTISIGLRSHIHAPLPARGLESL